MNQQSFHVKIGDGRRVVLPTEVCRQLGLGVGDDVVLRIENDRATISSVDHAIARFQSILARQLPPDANLVGELISERREEAKRE